MPASPTARPRRRLVFALIAIAFLVGFLSAFALWSKRQLLETDSWTETSTELLADDAIRTAVGGYLVDTLFSEVDVQAELEEALPPQAAPAAGPIAGAIRRLADDVALEALQRPRVQELWEGANETAHAALLRIVEEGGDGEVTLDLGDIVDELGQRVGIAEVSSRLPEGAAEIVILETDQLEAASSGVDLLETLAWALLALALVLFAIAIYLAAGWRREALRSVGVAFVAVGIAVLVARQVAGNYIVDQLATTSAVEPATEATWTIGTSLLTEIGSASIFYGVVIVIGAWLAGPSGAGRAVRRELAPVLAGRGTAYAALAIVVLLLFAWSPTPGFERLPVSILLIVLLVVGVEALRRQALNDFPEQTWDTGVRRWKDAARSVAGRGGPHGPAPPP